MKALTGFLATAAFALSAHAQQQVPVVNLPSAKAKSITALGAVLGIHEVAGGRVLVNDAGHRQLLSFDSTLAIATVVLDSVAGAPNSYGTRAAPLIPYLGDSSLFVDFNSRTLLVLDASGRVARALALPNPQDIFSIAGSYAGVDTKGRLLYRGPQLPPAPSPGAHTPDSAPVLRADLDLRRIDTVGRVNRPGLQMTFQQGDDGKLHSTMIINPLPTVDEWAALSDGSIAFVRGHDYHIDWIRPDGSTFSTSKLSFDWKRLAIEDKQKLIDSARAAQNASAPKSSASGGGGRAGATPVQPGAAPSVKIVPPSEVADYYPPMHAGAAMPDRDGNLWILPTTSAQSLHGELVYDVVSLTGGLVKRVRIPAGRVVVGFGRGSVVYLTTGERATGFHLERSRLPQ